jgi:hypothetical protein
MRDWALIKLAVSQFAGNPKNKVYIPPSLERDKFSLKNGDDSSADLIYHPGVGDLPECHGKVMAAQSMDLPLLWIHDISAHTIGGRQSSNMMKRGRSTGLTYGVTNEIEALCRYAVRRSEVIISQQWLTISAPDGRLSSPRQGTPFSAGGDSGACVLDTEGKAVAILNGALIPCQT